MRSGELPGTLPRGVVFPSDHDAVVHVVRYAVEHGIPVVPYGAGSGVLGGSVPLSNELVVDLKRLNCVKVVDTFNGLVTVGAGINGGQLESLLNAQGYTCGHLPQSLNMSTVGGWVACRGAGQASGLYGKIEDIVLGLACVLPNGETLRIQPLSHRSTGPSLRDLLVGSEGTLGIITEVTLRIWRQPECEIATVFALPDQAAGLELCRQVVQSELRPSVMRLYDLRESAERTKGLSAFDQRPILCMLMFSGPRRVIQEESAMAGEIAAAVGAAIAPDDPITHWRNTRFDSYSARRQSADEYMDTIEVVVPWSAVSAFYEATEQLARSIHPEMHFGAHWSHSYSESVCQYMTFRLPRMPQAQGLALHAATWDGVCRLALVWGGSIAHHHGAGAFRGPWMAQEHQCGMQVLQSIKDSMDPDNLFNPGKLGLRPRPNAVRMGYVASGVES